MGLKDETQKLHIADLTIKNRQPLVYFIFASCAVAREKLKLLYWSETVVLPAAH